MLVDTSVWVDHLRRRDAVLIRMLEEMQAWTHPFVIGELACGHLPRRDTWLESLAALPQVSVAAHEEVLAFVAAHRLMGRGLGWIEMHLLAAATLARIPFWTRDRRLAAVATELGIGPRR